MIFYDHLCYSPHKNIGILGGLWCNFVSRALLNPSLPLLRSPPIDTATPRTPELMTMLCDPEALDSLSEDAIAEILHDWAHFCDLTVSLLSKTATCCSLDSQLGPAVASLCDHGLASLLQDHFLLSLEVITQLCACSIIFRYLTFCKCTLLMHNNIFVNSA